MDLNYLLHRQQVERSLAEAATSLAARKAHEDLAQQYEQQIEAVTGEDFGFPESNARADCRSPG